jgi:hypothetical protein
MSLTDPTLAESAWKHKGAIGICALFVIVACLLSFWVGTRKAKEWADSAYLQEREERGKKLVILEAQNEELKQQNEVQAEILRANDAKLKGDAVKFTQLLEERNERIKNIDATNPDDQLCGLCADAARSGFPLSLSTCGRCSTTP